MNRDTVRPGGKKGSHLSFGIMAHGGAGAPRTYSNGCRKACETGFEMLDRGESALEAAVEAVRLLEDDGRFNAGTGSTLRLDGKTVEMDAAVMDCEGRIGSVIAIRHVRNPVVVARRVLDTPHVALAGEGATLFARLQGLEPWDGVSPASMRRFRKLQKLIKQNKLGDHDERWNNRDLKSLWNFETPFLDIFPADTVGAVAMDRQGGFAAAISTGGASPMLLGRVGDVPFVGCGFYAGESGAVAVTGVGEEIVRKMLSKSIYEKIAAGTGLREILLEALDLFPQTAPLGIIAINRTEFAGASNRGMPSAHIIA